MPALRAQLASNPGGPFENAGRSFIQPGT